jgi:anti-anti-sigma factor
VSAVVAELHVDEASAEVVVHPPEQIDAATRPVLDMLLTQAIALGADCVVLDLAEVRLLDRPAVDLIVQTAAQARAAGSVLVVRHPSAQYLRLAWLLRDDRLLDLVEQR